VDVSPDHPAFADIVDDEDNAVFVDSDDEERVVDNDDGDDDADAALRHAWMSFNSGAQDEEECVGDITAGADWDAVRSKYSSELLLEFESRSDWFAQ
jgi:hypothetical protein